MVIYNDLIIEKAQKIIVDHIVKTLDAIHLASAKALNLDVTFVSCDNQQLHIAKKLGLHTINPIPN